MFSRNPKPKLCSMPTYTLMAKTLGVALRILGGPLETITVANHGYIRTPGLRAHMRGPYFQRQESDIL